MKRNHLPYLVVLVFCFLGISNAETFILKSGETFEGEIVREVGNNVTISTSGWLKTYPITEFDEAWLNEHKDLFEVLDRQKRTGEAQNFKDFLKALVGNESLAKATPFLTETRKYVLPISVGLIAIGLCLCFFGWNMFKFSTVLGGILSGTLLGIILSGVIANLVGSILPEKVAPWAMIGLFVLLVIPFVTIGAKFGRRFAMFGARTQALDGLGSGWMGSIFALTRFSFFDLSIIWGHAFFGAILLILGFYCAAVPLLMLPDENLQVTLLISIILAILLCIIGAISQIKKLRSEPMTGYQGEY
ncbi:hypothetical protein P0Y35_17725 [Kiritimatiellaeota bacterium B1221]|nr:hypothetical protein [Kiritimatiellaeota bacterium B1221]